MGIFACPVCFQERDSVALWYRSNPFMTPRLTDDQRQSLDAEGGRAFVFDDQRHMTWMIMSLQEFQRVWPLLDDDTFSIREAQCMQDAVARAEGWDDRRMSEYDRLAVPPQSP